MPVLKSTAEIEIKDMFISVNRCEIGQNSNKTAVMEVKDEFGIEVHSIITVKDIYEYLKETGIYKEMLVKMEGYMDKYCVL